MRKKLVLIVALFIVSIYNIGYAVIGSDRSTIRFDLSEIEIAEALETSLGSKGTRWDNWQTRYFHNSNGEEKARYEAYRCVEDAMLETSNCEIGKECEKSYYEGKEWKSSCPF